VVFPPPHTFDPSFIALVRSSVPPLPTLWNRMQPGSSHVQTGENRGHDSERSFAGLRPSREHPTRFALCSSIRCTMRGMSNRGERLKPKVRQLKRVLRKISGYLDDLWICPRSGTYLDVTVLTLLSKSLALSRSTVCLVQNGFNNVQSAWARCGHRSFSPRHEDGSGLGIEAPCPSRLAGV
jgi:hypothetical protein